MYSTTAFKVINKRERSDEKAFYFIMHYYNMINILLVEMSGAASENMKSHKTHIKQNLVFNQLMGKLVFKNQYFHTKYIVSSSKC